ncbi:glycosyltransferase [Methylobacterium sp. Leaf100]|uniref:glycosyltransferase family 2 protein n=1 Tax=Methylobacterium sp. Leaf100 TaxID=1736252 RepID=UPI0006F5FD64|nr:glycosyltransferase [Methylobacterium sp. Leaf100]KQP31927.1 glycosyl transferase [Methylobacterium sp. Leaf100]
MGECPLTDEHRDALLFAHRIRPGILARLRMAVAILAQHPSAILAIAKARLMGKRVRAAQARAALLGLDHRKLWLTRRDRRIANLLSEVVPVIEERDLVVLTTPGHTLVSGSQERLVRTFAAHPHRVALYGDALDVSGSRIMPLLRPAFDAEYLRAVDYIGPVVAVRRTALDAIGGIIDLDPEAPALDALLRLAGRFGSDSIGHLPQILSIGAAVAAGEGGRSRRAGRLAIVRRDLVRAGEGDVATRMDEDGVITLWRSLPDPVPSVSLIVPTRDRLDLLRPCLDSLIHRTDWPDREILVCDNDSRDPETMVYLGDLAADGVIRVVPCPGPFDFAAMNNRAAAVANGRVLAFVNNDVTATDPTWLDRMVREALRPEIGAVGARLIDGRGRIQHGGVILGPGGLVTHAHRYFSGDAPGYLSGLLATRAVSAVTAACLVVEARKFAAVEGFDAAAFAVDFNDVDLCLRLNEAGYRTLYVGGAILIHDEAASRRWTPEARARHEREVTAFKKRWGPLLAQDPHYHSGFDPDLGTYTRLRSGWQMTGPVAPR